MKTLPMPKHDWQEVFWEDFDGDKYWLADYAAQEDRRIFELEIEGMVEESIPRDLSALLSSFHRCEWRDRPKSAICDLPESLETALKTVRGAPLRAWVITQSYQGVVERHVEDKPNLRQMISGPPVELPYPYEYLEELAKDLHYYILLTIWHFSRNYPAFLTSLPGSLFADLYYELPQVAGILLLSKLRSASAQT